MRDTADAQGHDRRLDTWKEIAAYFGRDVRTAKRWERQRGLPVRRLPGGGGRVYAYVDELAAWLRTAGDAPEPAEAPNPPQRRMASALLLAGIAVLVAVGVWLLAQPRAPARWPAATATAHRPDPEAQRLYLKGLYEWNSRTPDGLTQAVDDFTQAIVRDPQYARPYVGLADTYNLLREYTLMPPEVAYPKAKAAAERAIALDDRLADAHSALGFVDFFWSWDGPAAEREFRRAIALDPSSANAHHWYASALMHMGRLAEAQAEIRRAVALQPESAAMHADEALIQMKAGRVAEGKAVLQQMERVDPGFLSPHRYLLEAALLGDGDWRNYVHELRRIAELRHDRDGLSDAAAAADALRKGGSGAMFDTLARSAQARFDAGRAKPLELARAYALAGDKARMLPLLRQAIAAHDPNAVGVAMDPAFKAYWRDPDVAPVIAAIRGKA